MEMATKNIGVGERITNLTELYRLAKERKSVIWGAGHGTYVRPAAFFLQWRLADLIKIDLYYTVKV